MVCHGIPDDTKLCKGDLINVDVTVFLDGCHGDTSRTFIVGSEVDESGVQLVSVCEDCMMAGIEACKKGATVYDVQKAFHAKLQCFLQKHPSHEFVFDTKFSSHGIGREFHAAPNLHTKLGSGDIRHVLKEGQTLTIEPILMECESPTVICDDQWTCTSTFPLARSAQFEHTVLVTSGEPEILT